jgi:CRISPR-associated endonuclease Cas2
MHQRDRVLAVFCYDISRDRTRTRIVELLEEDAVRVQESVFEGWMRRAHATRLASRAARLLGPDDLLRVYCLGPEAATRTLAFGPAPPVEAHDFHLL